MKRNPRKVKWTKAYRRLHGKDMTQVGRISCEPIFFPLVSSVVTDSTFYYHSFMFLEYLNWKDATFEFERKRNRPERFDKNVTENTLKAIKKIDKVRIAREAAHHKNRFVFFVCELVYICTLWRIHFMFMY